MQTFRGAEPALVGRAVVTGSGPGELGARTTTLRTVWRHDAALREVVGRITERIGSVGAVRHRTATAVGQSGEGARVALLPSTAQEAAYVAHALRTAHIERNVPWDHMAVIAPTGAQVTDLRRALAGASVPVSVLGSDVPLRDEPAVAPLLEAMRVCVGTEPLEASTAARLACSPLGGLDAVGLRRVRRALRAHELAAGGGRASDELLVEVLSGDDPDAGADRGACPWSGWCACSPRAALPRRAPKPMLRPCCGRSGLRSTTPRPGVVPRSRAARRGSGPTATSMPCSPLFRAAETFVDRMPRSAPAAFVDWLAGAGPALGLAGRARASGARSRCSRRPVRPVASGRSSSWRGCRTACGPICGCGTPCSVRRRWWTWSRGGWRRACVRPGSRGRGGAAGGARRRAAHVRGRLLAGAIVSAGDGGRRRRPPALPVRRAGRAERSRTSTRDARAHPRPSTCAVWSPSCARTSSSRPSTVSTLTPAAAQTLARLASAGVAGADPEQWLGLAGPSSDGPLWAPDERVPVSPSKVETAQRCALRWALESAGGTASASGGQNLGTLLHAIAQEHPQGTEAELSAALDRRWGELGPRHGVAGDRRRGGERTRWCTGWPGTCAPRGSRCWSRARSRSIPTGPPCAGASTASSGPTTAPCGWWT